MKSLPFVAAHMRVDPGRLVLGKTRRVATAVGPIYLVPTTRGGVCLQGRLFATCDGGLVRQGIAWHFQSATDGIDLVGLAADDVSAVAIEHGRTVQRASLRDNVFFVHQPVTLTPGRSSYRLGTLEISYRDGRPKAAVPIR
ncbi:MAG TPA: hypothetical protein VJ814_08235 [Gaiellaceae bacterium]|nr:hypothetical protein [Gaiellaceae bacterium]